MLKIKFSTLAAACASLLLVSPTFGYEAFEMDNIETILKDNMLNDAVNRYSSVILSFKPEQATRLGFSSANEKLNRRSAQQSTHMRVALQSVQDSLNGVVEKQLSPAKRVERALLANALAASMAEEEQNLYLNNPLYYTQSLDAVYDLMTKQLASPTRQRLELMRRLNELSNVAAQAEQNLTDASPLLAQIAMEKIYYAFLSYNEWAEFLSQNTIDPDVKIQSEQVAKDAKKAVQRMFETFKPFSKKENGLDFRLGLTAYFDRLEINYQVKKPAMFVKGLEKRVQDAQQELSLRLEPFMEQLEAQEITVVDENNPASTETLEDTNTSRSSKKSSQKNNNVQVRNGQDFYAVAKQFMTTPIDKEPLQTLQKDADSALAFFITENILPPLDITFSIGKLPQYFTYTQSYLFTPPFGDQANPKSNFFWRIPTGSERVQQELFNQDFNVPARKVMISSQLVPGRYYQAQATLGNSQVRRLYPSISMLNGWSAYAKRLAKRAGYFSTDEDLAFLAWDEYLQALAAYVDAQLHTQQFTYEEALEFLTQTHGLNQAQAESIAKNAAAQPGEAVSYFVGLDALEDAYRKYSKKLGRKFSEEDFHAKLFQIGNVPPDRLDKELTRLYKKKK